jgi:hypothetical protein
MPLFNEDAVAFGQDGFTSSATAVATLGSRAVTKDGRVFHYAQAGAADLVAGNVQQSAAPIAQHLANTAPAVAIGATSFVYTPGSTAGAANLYAEGYLATSDSTGAGYTYQVSGHGAITASTAFTLYLMPSDPIQVALTTSTKLGLVHNPYKNVIINPTTATAAVAGVSGYVITATQYGWLQTWGPATVLINGTPGVGIGVVISATTAGAVDVAAVAAEINVRIIGHMMQVGVSTKFNFVSLKIMP